MNNEEAKREAIVKAYGSLWETIDEDIQNRILSMSGWTYELNEEFYQTKLNIEVEKGTFRPASLKGFDTNNGWTRIETGTVMPDSSVKVKVIAWSGKVDEAKHFKDGIWIHPEFPMREIRNVTHFKLIKEEIKPIY